MAVVLHQPVDPIAVHHAGHKAVVTLERCIPGEEFTQRLGQPGLCQGSPHDHTVPDPGAGITPGAGLDGRAVAVDQNVPGRSAETIKGGGGAGGNLPFHLMEGAVPAGEGFGPGLFPEGATFVEIRHRDRDLDRGAAGGEVPRHGGGGITGFVQNGGPGWYDPAGENPEDAAFLESGRALGIRRRREIHPAAFHLEVAGLTGNPVNRADAAEIAEGLPGRIHLERTHCDDQPGIRCRIVIPQPVGHVESEGFALAIDPWPDIQLQIIRFPGDGRHRNAVFGETAGGLHICPGDALAGADHKRLEGKARFVHLDHAFLVDQSTALSLRTADRGPVGLLAQPVAREPSPWEFRGDLVDELIGGAGISVRTERQGEQRGSGGSGEGEPQVLGFRAGGGDMGFHAHRRCGLIDRCP